MIDAFALDFKLDVETTRLLAMPREKAKACVRSLRMDLTNARGPSELVAQLLEKVARVSAECQADEPELPMTTRPSPQRRPGADFWMLSFMFLPHRGVVGGVWGHSIREAHMFSMPAL